MCEPLKYGMPLNKFVFETFSDCIYTIPEHISFVLGIVGLLAAISAQLPQCYTNFRLKDASGLSLGLVILWTSGDMTNYFGTIYANQLITQQLAAISFCGTDIIFVVQYVYYVHLYPSFNYNPLITLEDDEIEILIENQTYDHKLTFNPIIGSSSLLVANLPIVNATFSSNHFTGYTKDFGYIMAWASVSLYIGSRIPQILKNHNEKSVHGISLAMFILNVIGNGCYGLSVLIRLDKVDIEFWLCTFPYMVGSWGVLLLDVVMLVQVIHYRK